MHASTAEIMPSIRRRARRPRATARGGIATLPTSTRGAPPYAVVLLGAFLLAAVYAVFFSGVRCGAAAETHPGTLEPGDAGTDGPPADAAAVDNYAHLGLIGQPRRVSRDQADASPRPAGSPDADSRSSSGR